MHRPTGRIIETRDVVFDEGEGGEQSRVQIDLRVEIEESDDSGNGSNVADNEPGGWDMPNESIEGATSSPTTEDEARSMPEPAEAVKARTLSSSSSIERPTFRNLTWTSRPLSESHPSTSLTKVLTS